MFKTMKNYVIILALISVPSVVFSAEAKFHGLKTGMNQKEVIQYLRLDKMVSDKKTGEFSILYRDKNNKQIMGDLITGGIAQQDLEKISKHKDFTNKKFTKLYLDFTQGEILWRISVSFYVPSDTLEKIALKKVIEKYFPGQTIKEESVSSQYGTSHFYMVTMVDDKISDAAIKKHVKSFLKEM